MSQGNWFTAPGQTAPSGVDGARERALSLLERAANTGNDDDFDLAEAALRELARRIETREGRQPT